MTRIHTHPGEVLLNDFLKPSNTTIAAFAEQIGEPKSIIREICFCHRGVDAALAEKLSKKLNTSVAFWLNLQAQHDKSVVVAALAQVGARKQNA